MIVLGMKWKELLKLSVGNKLPIEDRSLLDQIVARLDPSGGLQGL